MSTETGESSQQQRSSPITRGFSPSDFHTIPSDFDAKAFTAHALNSSNLSVREQLASLLNLIANEDAAICRFLDNSAKRDELARHANALSLIESDLLNVVQQADALGGQARTLSDRLQHSAANMSKPIVALKNIQQAMRLLRHVHACSIVERQIKQQDDNDVSRIVLIPQLKALIDDESRSGGNLSSSVKLSDKLDRIGNEARTALRQAFDDGADPSRLSRLLPALCYVGLGQAVVDLVDDEERALEGDYLAAFDSAKIARSTQPTSGLVKGPGFASLQTQRGPQFRAAWWSSVESAFVRLLDVVRRISIMERAVPRDTSIFGDHSAGSVAGQFWRRSVESLTLALSASASTATFALAAVESDYAKLYEIVVQHCGQVRRLLSVDDSDGVLPQPCEILFKFDAVEKAFLSKVLSQLIERVEECLVQRSEWKSPMEEADAIVTVLCEHLQAISKSALMATDSAFTMAVLRVVCKSVVIAVAKVEETMCSGTNSRSLDALPENMKLLQFVSTLRAHLMRRLLRQRRPLLPASHLIELRTTLQVRSLLSGAVNAALEPSLRFFRSAVIDTIVQMEDAYAALPAGSDASPPIPSPMIKRSVAQCEQFGQRSLQQLSSACGTSDQDDFGNDELLDIAEERVSGVLIQLLRSIFVLSLSSLRSTASTEQLNCDLDHFVNAGVRRLWPLVSLSQLDLLDELRLLDELKVMLACSSDDYMSEVAMGRLLERGQVRRWLLLVFIINRCGALECDVHGSSDSALPIKEVQSYLEQGSQLPELDEWLFSHRWQADAAKLSTIEQLLTAYAQSVHARQQTLYSPAYVLLRNLLTIPSEPSVEMSSTVNTESGCEVASS